MEMDIKERILAEKDKLSVELPGDSKENLLISRLPSSTPVTPLTTDTSLPTTTTLPKDKGRDPYIINISRLPHSVIKLITINKIVISLVLLFTLLLLIFVSNGDGRIITACVILILLSLAGIRGAFRAERKYLTIFIYGLYTWILACILGVIIYLTTTTTSSFASDRCQVTSFLSLYGTNCTLSSTNKNTCLSNCLTMVKQHLDLEAALLLVIVSAIMAKVGYTAQQLDEKITAFVKRETFV